ncbi:threonine/serine exporter family protein [Indiicoccus explosivorum]|uniref:threonine/serine exporter family protein n=1 Tax=Indiicoccus explosivorum TaxID=1917864 RepID=UPI000B43B909|nr:threonine/serine exporter family protein [Indiicoccus explosivorum]
MHQAGETRRELALECCLLAGRLMIEGGAETYRVEDTMERMATSQLMPNSHCSVTPTGIMFSPSDEQPTRFVRIRSRRTDLKQVALVNAVSRRLVAGDFSLQEAYEELMSIESSHTSFDLRLQIFAAAVASGCFLLLFGGARADVPYAAVIGGTGFIITDRIERLTRIRFFAEFVAAVLIGVLAYAVVGVGLGEELDGIIIGSVMPLVPGLLITNAVRDLMAGHFVSGLSKGAEAFLTAFAIGAGIALVLSF